MLSFEQMLWRFAVALILGAILGVEREIVGKEEAGVRTEMVVTGGAALFTIIGLLLPYVSSEMLGKAPDALTATASFGVIASIVSGIGFLGAGLIIKTSDKPHGITTAALVWTSAAIGILAGIGLIKFATVAAILITALLYLLRGVNVSGGVSQRK